MISIIRDIGEYERLMKSVVITFFWLTIWQMVYWKVGKQILVASPFQTAERLLHLSTQRAFVLSVGGTCLRVLSGFLSALLAGTVLAVLSYGIPLFHRAICPVLDVMRVTPVASFIILALVWLKSSTLPACISALMVLPIIWSNVFNGLRNSSRQLLEMSQVFGLSWPKKIRAIYMPAVMPYFCAACHTGLGIAWKSTIAAEIISHPRYAIGTQIYNAKIYLETADLFAWTSTVILLSLVLEKGTGSLFRMLSRNRHRCTQKRGQSHA